MADSGAAAGAAGLAAATVGAGDGAGAETIGAGAGAETTGAGAAAAAPPFLTTRPLASVDLGGGADVRGAGAVKDADTAGSLLVVIVVSTGSPAMRLARFCASRAT